MYFAFRELGRAIRTIFLLRYISDPKLRRTIHAATNKSEEFNKFAQWAFFGGERVIAENVRHEQRKVVKYNHLVANMLILNNVHRMSKVARAWAAGFVRWYNHDHRHSGIRYVSPAQRHAGEDHAILAARHALYMSARALNPARWSGSTRNWSPIGSVTLNPERDSIVKMHSTSNDIQPMAA